MGIPERRQSEKQSDLMKLVVATGNIGKLKEIALKLEGVDIELLSLADFPKLEPAPEEGDTFKKNALSKAEYIGAKTGLTALADDSGLCVDALDGAPGIYSARFSGADATDEKNNALLLKKLEGVPENERTARFKCVIALATPDGRHFFSEGVWEGSIGFEPKGGGGFGYDPLFVSAIDGKTAAELPPLVKNNHSHRGQAVAGIIPVLKKLAEE